MAPIDQGTGATFAALADRGLIEVDWRDYNVHGQRKPYIRLTPAGRRLARSWTGRKAQNVSPAGTLREWHWRALAKAYAAGIEGVEGEYGYYGRIGWNTWLRLRDYKWVALIEERGGPVGGLSPRAYRAAHHCGRLRAARARVGALPRAVSRRGCTGPAAGWSCTT
jgi:hypothetical protein